MRDFTGKLIRYTSDDRFEDFDGSVLDLSMWEYGGRSGVVVDSRTGDNAISGHSVTKKEAVASLYMDVHDKSIQNHITLEDMQRVHAL